MRESGFIIFFFTSLTAWGQSAYPTARELRTLFQEKKNNFWIACNDDSSYFKNDEVQLLKYVDYHHHSKDCCKFVQWRFQKKLKITFNEAQVCTELREKTLYSYKKVKITDHKGITYLEVTSTEHRSDTFKVIALSTKELWTGGQPSIVLTLKREAE